MHTARRKKRSFTGNSARNLSSFFGDAFSQDKENERRRTSVPQAKFDAVFGKLSPNLKSFFGDVFSQNKENERRRTSVLQAKFDAVFGKLSPNLKSFFGDAFSQDKASKPPLYVHTARRKKRRFTVNSARTSNHFSVMFFRKTRLLSRRCIRIPQGERNEVLRKNSPKNQISIMSASFFFAISSISLTYLSVIF